MITLSSGLVPSNVKVGLMDFSRVIRPDSGGKAQKINRLGNRFAAEVEFPPVRHADKGRALIADLVQGKRLGLRIPIPLQGVTIPTEGTPRIVGANQTGHALSVDGFDGAFTAPRGTIFSIEDGTSHRVYMLGADLNPTGGAALLQIEPALRQAFPDNARLHFQEPMIEGFVIGEKAEWEWQIANLTKVTLMIEEAE